jgi:hypothetical protein
MICQEANIAAFHVTYVHVCTWRGLNNIENNNKFELIERETIIIQLSNYVYAVFFFIYA